jgi:hypothetical protein
VRCVMGDAEKMQITSEAHHRAVFTTVPPSSPSDPAVPLNPEPLPSSSDDQTLGHETRDDDVDNRAAADAGASAADCDDGADAGASAADCDDGADAGPSAAADIHETLKPPLRFSLLTESAADATSSGIAGSSLHLQSKRYS